ncbi:MAG TPA: hypothetical protein VF641_01810 [Methylobacterium sp.]
MPGTTAEKRLAVWIDRELTLDDAHADAKGRDAYAFDPLVSPYLEVGDDLTVRTPYSRTVIETLRGLAPAHWAPERRAWRLPFRAYEALRAVWPVIEAAARRNEPEAKRRRGGDADRVVQAERRRRRCPVPRDDPPPLGVAIATAPFGVVTFEALDAGPPLAPEDLPALGIAYRDVAYVWGRWRPPTWRELADGEPAASIAPEELARGWWVPTASERAERRRRLRRTESVKSKRSSTTAPAEGGPSDRR